MENRQDRVQEKLDSTLVDLAGSTRCVKKKSEKAGKCQQGRLYSMQKSWTGASE
jgi:hypothetical protein